ncbi:pyridoxamine 5'-phosphate oxidase family protein [Kitasatospora sp. NPDC093679]|uniref:pyridoxamine 5'-phosphate oxidase family protein n=1 Tax=Kitasatospora sp. NPDC093679 TaxID=3154983 RepID=UPI00342684FC
MTGTEELRQQSAATGGEPAAAAPGPRDRRRRDTEHRLTHDVDVWVASASADGGPYLVPLSFDWDGEALLVATPADSPTGRNPAATRTAQLGLGPTRTAQLGLGPTRTAQLGLGPTRDVTVIDGDVDVDVDVLEIDALPPEQGDRFATRTGFDPRTLTTPYRWFRISPHRIQAWREADELSGRTLMRDGRWLA